MATKGQRAIRSHPHFVGTLKGRRDLMAGESLGTEYLFSNPGVCPRCGNPMEHGEDYYGVQLWTCLSCDLVCSDEGNEMACSSSDFR